MGGGEGGGNFEDLSYKINMVATFSQDKRKTSDNEND